MLMSKMTKGCCIFPVLQVGVPKHMAMILTFPEFVTEHNIARLRQNVLNGAKFNF